MQVVVSTKCPCSVLSRLFYSSADWAVTPAVTNVGARRLSLRSGGSNKRRLGYYS